MIFNYEFFSDACGSVHLTISHFGIISLLPISLCNHAAEMCVLTLKSFPISIVIVLHTLKLEMLGLMFYIFERLLIHVASHLNR